MKLKCPRSGISYHCNIGYGHGSVPHPIFSLPIKALIKGHLAPFQENKLSAEETHLFGCALLAQLPVIWDSPLQFDIWGSDEWLPIIESLATTAMRHDNRNNKSLPRFRITKGTAFPGPIKNYIRSFNIAMTEMRDFGSEYNSTFIKDRAEQAILKILNSSLNKTRESAKLPTIMANWAASVGRFPKTEIPINADGLRMPLAEYWKGIIVRAFEADSPVAILDDDIEVEDIIELLEHCEQNIEIGTLHSLVLFKKLRNCIEVLMEFRPRKIEITQEKISSAYISSLLLENEEPVKEYEKGEPKMESFKNIAQYLAAKKAWAAKKEQEGECYND